MRPLALAPHPSLRVAVLEAPVEVHPSPADLRALLRSDAQPPPPFAAARGDLARVHGEVRALLRHTGYKPSGRGKPASEFLAAAAAAPEGVREVSNVVDVNNVVSLHTGLPISVFDAHRLTGPLRIAPGGDDEAYVFNAAGHEIRLRGLLTVYHRPDPQAAWVPAGTPVKDANATKVHDGTTHVLAVLYSHAALGGDWLDAAAAWYAALLRTSCGAPSVDVAKHAAPAAPTETS